STMAGSASARISSCGASSFSNSRPNLPSKSRTVLPMREAYPSRGSISEPARPLGGNYTGIHAHPVEPAEEAAVLDFHAAVHDRFQPGGPRLRCGGLILHSELLPEHLGADSDRFLGDRRHVLGLAEHVDDVHPVGDFP